jgi:hypothetical protein
MKTKLLTFFIFALFFISLTSAGLLSNDLIEQPAVKGEQIIIGEDTLSYTSIWEKYPPVKIEDGLIFKEKVLDGAITKHDEFCGVDCLSEFTLVTYTESVLIEDIKFYTLEENGVTLDKPREENIRYYNLSIKEKEEWIPYYLGTTLPAGTYEVKLMGSKKPSRSVDWIIKTQDVTIDSWATWGATIGIGGVTASVNLLSPSNGYSQFLNSVTTSSFANVTDGSSLANVTLWSNSTGTWGARNTTNLLTHGVMYTNLTQFGVNSGGSYVLITTYYLNAQYITNVTAEMKSSSNTGTGYLTFVYNDTTTSNSGTLDYGTGYTAGTFNNSNPYKKVSKIEVYGKSNSGTNTQYINNTIAYGFNASTTYTASYTNYYNKNTTTLWNMRYCDTDGGCGFSSSNYTFSIYANRTIWSLCNLDETPVFLNVTFKDETTLEDVNGSIQDSTWGYDSTTYTFYNTTASPSYYFCYTPNATVSVTPYVQYKSGLDYPQRIWNPAAQTYTNSTTNQILYLLNTLDGISVTLQVVNSAEQVLGGVSINITRNIAGVQTVVGVATTGSDGTATFFLNPDFSHTLTASKEGYTTYSTTFNPTSSTYTIKLSSDTGVGYNDYTFNVTSKINPPKMELTNDTRYNFNYTISSGYWNLTNFGFKLRLYNGTILNSTSSTSNGGTVIAYLNVSDYPRIYMDYYYSVNGTYINSTAEWNVFNPSYSGWSILTFFSDLTLYMNSGLFGLDDFGRNLIIFIILFFSVGIMSYKFGLVSPIAISAVIFSVIFFFDIVVGLLNIEFMNGTIQHPLTFISLLILVILVIKEAQN